MEIQPSGLKGVKLVESHHCILCYGLQQPSKDRQINFYWLYKNQWSITYMMSIFLGVTTRCKPFLQTLLMPWMTASSKYREFPTTTGGCDRWRWDESSWWLVVKISLWLEKKKITKKPGWWYTYPSEKYESQLGWLFQIYGKIKNVPNHQPETYIRTSFKEESFTILTLALHPALGMVHLRFSEGNSNICAVVSGPDTIHQALPCINARSHATFTANALSPGPLVGHKPSFGVLGHSLNLQNGVTCPWNVLWAAQNRLPGVRNESACVKKRVTGAKKTRTHVSLTALCPLSPHNLTESALQISNALRAPSNTMKHTNNTCVPNCARAQISILHRLQNLEAPALWVP